MTLDRRTLLAILAPTALVLIICVLLFYPPGEMNEAVKGMLQMLVGVLAAQVTQVYNYDFGSSSGSKAKDDALIAAAETPQMARRRVEAEEPTVPMTVTVEKQELEAEIKP